MLETGKWRVDNAGEISGIWSEWFGFGCGIIRIFAVHMMARSLESLYGLGLRLGLELGLELGLYAGLEARASARPRVGVSVVELCQYQLGI